MKRACVFAGISLLSMVAAGCADPLMKKSELPDKIDFSGGTVDVQPVVPAAPSTEPAHVASAFPATAPIEVPTTRPEPTLSAPVPPPATQP